MRCDRGINSIPEQNIYLYCFCWASPGGSAVKNLSAMQELQEMQGFSTWVRKIPWRRKWQPTPVFLLRESYGQRGLEGLQSMGSQRVGHDWSNVAFFLPALMEINYSYFLNRSDFFFLFGFFFISYTTELLEKQIYKCNKHMFSKKQFRWVYNLQNWWKLSTQNSSLPRVVVFNMVLSTPKAIHCLGILHPAHSLTPTN